MWLGQLLGILSTLTVHMLSRTAKRAWSLIIIRTRRSPNYLLILIIGLWLVRLLSTSKPFAKLARIPKYHTCLSFKTVVVGFFFSVRGRFWKMHLMFYIATSSVICCEHDIFSVSRMLERRERENMKNGFVNEHWCTTRKNVRFRRRPSWVCYL